MRDGKEGLHWHWGGGVGGGGHIASLYYIIRQCSFITYSGIAGVLRYLIYAGFSPQSKAYLDEQILTLSRGRLQQI